MVMNQRSAVVGVFTDIEDARSAVRDLRSAGFDEEQIGVVAHDREGRPVEMSAAQAEDTSGSKAGKGAAIGAAVGGGGGALWALGVAAGLLPAIGPVIAGGVLAAVLASAAGGAAVGGIVGALAGLGVPEEEARFYDDEFRAGRTLVTVTHTDRLDEAFNVLRRNRGYDYQSRPQTGTSPHAHL